MLRHELAADLRSDELAPGYVRPDYDGYCFASVPATVAELLGAGGAVDGPRLPTDAVPDGSGIERVAVVLVDGFGFEQFERHRDAAPFLSRLAERARVTPLTSTFPSETAAAMTTYYLGTPPLAHGLLGWNVYRPGADAVVKPLPFETAGGADPATLGLSGEDFREGRPVGSRLARAGVDVRRVVPAALAGDDDGSGSNGGQTYYGYGGEGDDAVGLGRELGAALAEAGAPGFVHAYAPAVDAAGHRHGTRAGEYRETVARVLEAVGRAVEGVASERAPETLVVVCADHGHVDTDPDRNVDLLAAPAVASLVGETSEGTPRVSGSPRNVHLHVDDPASTASAAEQALAERDCEALVLRRSEALAEGLWGPGVPSATFQRHCGDPVVLPRDLGVWHGGEREELEMVGMHGGLHADEMLVPFAAARADRLQ